ncbi:MAG: ABC transporter substrate-binding protein [Thermomicrobiales bacterium]
MDHTDHIAATMIDDLLRRPLLRRRALQGAAAAALAGTALGRIRLEETAAADAATLVVASGADAVTLDPQVSFDGQSPLLWRAVYENLVKYDGDTLDIVPHLAENYDISDDGLTYTFTIRPGITFSDGTPLDAAAVKTSIDRQIAVQMGIAYALANVTSVETPDDMTVVLTLSAPSDGVLSAFAGMYAPYIISPKAISEHEQNGDWAQAWLRDNMVGTGPYVLDNYSQSQQAVFSRNPNYWGGWDGNHFEQIFVKYVKEPATERLLLEQGEVDVALFLPDDAVEELDGTGGIVVTDVPSFNLYYLVLPTREGPTADKKVRQAISYGFDYNTWVTDVMRGKAQQARGPIPSNFVGFNPNTPQYTYDPDKAKQLLAEAGFPDGGFNINYTYETGYFWKRPLGELFQANMADLGITVDIQELSPSAWADLLSNPETANHAFGLVWWPTLKTPFDFMFSLFATGAQGTAGYNWGYYSNPELDKLLEDGASEPDEAKRMAIYAEAQDLLVDDAPALYVYEKRYRLPMRDTVEGFVFNGVYIETLNYYGMSKA